MSETKTRHPLGKRLPLAVITIAASTALILSGCSSSLTDNGAPEDVDNTESSSSASVDYDALLGEFDTEYTGADAENFVSLPEVKVVEGASFKVGFLTLYGAQAALKAVEDSAKAEVEALGGTFIAKDAQANPQTQVTQFDELIAADVDIIIGYPVVEAALAPSIERAAEKGIPFVAIGTPVDQSKPGVEGTVTSILQGYDYIVWKTVKELAEGHPGASFGVVNTALPIEAVNFMGDRMEYWGKEFGLEFVGRYDAKDDSAAGFRPATQELLLQNPDVDIIMTHIDQAAVAVAAAVESGGHDDVMVVSPNTGALISKQAIDAGQIDLAFRTPWELMGRTSARAAYSIVTDQNTPLPNIINIPGVLVTPETADSVPWIG